MIIIKIHHIIIIIVLIIITDTLTWMFYSKKGFGVFKKLPEWFTVLAQQSKNTAKTPACFWKHEGIERFGLGLLSAEFCCSGGEVSVHFKTSSCSRKSWSDFKMRLRAATRGFQSFNHQSKTTQELLIYLRLPCKLWISPCTSPVLSLASPLAWSSAQETIYTSGPAPARACWWRQNNKNNKDPFILHTGFRKLIEMFDKAQRKVW